MKCLSTPLRFLSVLPTELCLATVLKSGQSFRWNRFDSILVTQPDLLVQEGDGEEKYIIGEEFAIGHEERTIVLRQTSLGIHYRSLYNFSPPHTSFLLDLEQDTTLSFLKSYFNLSTKLVPLYLAWSEKDSHFKKKLESSGNKLEGIRVLNQPSWETLMSFICSSNNNISRITQMITKLCQELGEPLPHPTSFDSTTVLSSKDLSILSPTITATPASLHLYSFPPPTSLISPTTDTLLRELGFGYRAPYIHSSSLLLLSKAKELNQTPNEYLNNLKFGNLLGGLEVAREKLMEFKGVGRKVADCVALFGLGYNQVVPVDTHVFQIAIRDYAFPATKTTTLTPILHNKVASKLQSLWGTHSGWAQQVLFFADLKSTTSTSTLSKKKKGIKGEEIIIKGKWEEELEELMNTPGKKRIRKEVKIKVEVKLEGDLGYPTPSQTPKKKRKMVVKVEEEISPSKVF